MQVKLLDLLVSLVQTFWFNVYWLVYLLSVENVCISQSVCIFCIFSETWMLPILVLLAMVVYAGIALVFFYQKFWLLLFFLKKKVAYFSFLKRIDFSSAQNWVFMSFMKYFIGSKLGYLYFVKRIDYWLVQNLSIYLLFVNRCKKIGSFGPRSDHSLSMSAQCPLTEDVVEWFDPCRQKSR